MEDYAEVHFGVFLLAFLLFWIGAGLLHTLGGLFGEVVATGLGVTGFALWGTALYQLKWFWE